MYPRARRKMNFWTSFCLTGVILGTRETLGAPRALGLNETSTEAISKEEHLEHNIIDSDTEYDIMFNKKYGIDPSWHIGDVFNKNMHKYTLIRGKDNDNKSANSTDTGVNITSPETNEQKNVNQNVTITADNPVQENNISNNESDSMSVIPISKISIDQKYTKFENAGVLSAITTKTFIEKINETSTEISKFARLNSNLTEELSNISYSDLDTTQEPTTSTELVTINNNTLTNLNISLDQSTDSPLEPHNQTERRTGKNETVNIIKVTTEFAIEINDRTEANPYVDGDTDLDDAEVPIYTELDYETDIEVPDDYYDGKDSVPTAAPNTDAISVIFGLAGSVAETVAERILPKGIYDLYKRMQKQNEAIEAERLRSREENGGLGQFGRGILKSISSGLTRPLTQLMSGARDIGSLDSDRGFVGGLAAGAVGVADSVVSVAGTLTDSFKDRVQAIFPGTLWCGDGHSATARSSELGLFFLTDTCCRQHDACKLFIRAGDTRHGLTNTGLFTRSHCSCDTNFRNCLRKTNSLVSSQIGLTYFNVLGPQCFRKAHPIVRCIRRTRITGQKCEEYELDYSKPKMWQWFDSETF